MSETDGRRRLVAILAADAVGYSRLMADDDQATLKSLDAARAVFREQIESLAGRVVDTAGDSVLGVFDSIASAVNAALGVQVTLAALAEELPEPRRMQFRVGVHLGDVIEKHDGTVYGDGVNIASRLQAMAEPGGIVVSHAVQGAVSNRIDAHFADLGEHSVKNIARPVRAFRVSPRAMPAATLDRLHEPGAELNNLPQHLTSFIGREREVGEAKRLLTTTRLLTLVGMGGIGKTRLSQHIASDVSGAYPDGVWFVDFAPNRNPALVADALAHVLRVREEPGQPLTQTLCSHLKPLTSLLIFDNCEHLVAACADLVNALLRAAPNIRVLATTREALRVPGEQTYPLLPLPVPDRNASVEVLARFESVQLFMDRARLRRPGFVLTEKEAPAIAELCARVEGIPLALELAAARMRSMSIQDINRRLNDRFGLLTGGERVLLERQQTLHATIDWSYGLLQDNEKRVFERLSVFVGGFDLEAAEAICGAAPLDPADVMPVLTSLIEKSLVMVDESEFGTRYRQLETIRDFALHLLHDRADAAAISVRHCEHFRAFVRMASSRLRGPDSAMWSRRIDIDLDNLRAVIALALRGVLAPTIAAKIEVALEEFRSMRGSLAEARSNLRAALALPGVRSSEVDHAAALYAGAAHAFRQSDHAEAERMLEACLPLCRKLGNDVMIANALSGLALIRLHGGDAERARALADEALGIFRRLGDRLREAVALSHFGEICMYVSDVPAAKAYFEQCLVLVQEIGDPAVEAGCERSLGELALEAGDLRSARAKFERSLEICRLAGNSRHEAVAMWWIGKLDVVDGRVEDARRKLGQALDAFRAFEMNAEMLDCIEDHAAMLRSCGAMDDAVRLYGAVAGLRERLRLMRSPRGEVRWQTELATIRDRLGAARFDTAWREGQRWRMDEAIRCSLQVRRFSPCGAGHSDEVGE